MAIKFSAHLSKYVLLLFLGLVINTIAVASFDYSAPYHGTTTKAIPSNALTCHIKEMSIDSNGSMAIDVEIRNRLGSPVGINRTEAEACVLDAIRVFPVGHEAARCLRWKLPTGMSMSSEASDLVTIPPKKSITISKLWDSTCGHPWEWCERKLEKENAWTSTKIHQKGKAVATLSLTLRVFANDSDAEGDWQWVGFDEVVWLTHY